MRVVSADLDAEVASSSQGDTLQVSAWRGGALVAANLLVSSWSLSWDVSREVQGQCTLTIADPDGTLAPWGMGDALGPGGSLLSIAWVSGSSQITVPLGWWRIRKSAPTEQWRTYGTSSGPVRVSGGASVQVQADEAIMASAALCRMDAEVVPSGATVYAELRRILQDYGAVDTSSAPVDVTIPATYVYPESRASSIGDLLDMALAVGRCGPDGALQVIPAAGVGPVWTVQGGEDGALIGFSRQLDDASTYNAAVSRSATADGAPLVGRAFLTSGKLAYGGPYGKVPMFHQAIATTQSGVDQDAATLLANQTSEGTVDLSVTCLAHPGVQPHDLVTVVAPTVAGDSPLVGRVVAMSWSSAQSDAGTTPAKAMALTVRVSAGALEAVADRVARG